MKVELINKSNEEVSFILQDISVSFANAIRRIMIGEVPTMAIEEVEFKKNNSAIYDETVAQRLGLVVLKSDLKTYNLPEKCTCKGEGCAKCQVQLTLKERGAKTAHASSFKSKDPKITPVYGKTIIVKLLSGQEIELIATAVLGKGKDHAKFSPGLAIYKHEPIVEIKKQPKDAELIVKMCPKNLFEIKSGKLTLKKDYKKECHLCEACQDYSEGAVTISEDDNKYWFTIESWGSIPAKTIVKESANILAEKCDEFVEVMSKVK
tara:strand:- start:1588 stop:2379 length:792 start_codon:yes stop_codon:yes gene_type:complete